MSEHNPGTRSRLILVRHAHTDMAGTFCGSSDPPLSGRGLAQLRGLQERLKSHRITHIFSSPLQRARQTAEAIAAGHGLQVNCLEFLHELTFGSWEGLDWDQVMRRDAEYAQHWVKCYPCVPAPEGEHFEDFLQRVSCAMTAIADEAQSGCAAVITHAGVIRTFLGSVAQLRPMALDLMQCDYTSCWQLWREHGRWCLSTAAPDLITKHAEVSLAGGGQAAQKGTR